jgi:MscS family membrane protein
LASVGIGGLAVAPAARPTLENIIGSFMIFLDKPYRVGQRVTVMGHNGTVESIGLRSTKIRLLTGHLTSIPNQQMANAEVENIGRRPHIRRVLNVTITYDTPPEKISRAVEIVREILALPETAASETEITKGAEKIAYPTAATGEAENQPHPNEPINHPDFPPRVYFNEMNADSLNIIVIYWYHPPEYWDYLEHAQWINIQIKERFNAEGIDFAFPTQTLHMAGDDKRPLTVGQRWVSKEESFSPSAILAQAAALGAQAVQTPASDAMRPEFREPEEPKPRVEGELTDAPLEDDVLHGDGEGDDEDFQR